MPHGNLETLNKKLLLLKNGKIFSVHLRIIYFGIIISCILKVSLLFPFTFWYFRMYTDLKWSYAMTFLFIYCMPPLTSLNPLKEEAWLLLPTAESPRLRILPNWRCSVRLYSINDLNINVLIIHFLSIGTNSSMS